MRIQSFRRCSSFFLLRDRGSWLIKMIRANVEVRQFILCVVRYITPQFGSIFTEKGSYWRQISCCLAMNDDIDDSSLIWRVFICRTHFFFLSNQDIPDFESQNWEDCQSRFWALLKVEWLFNFSLSFSNSWSTITENEFNIFCHFQRFIIFQQILSNSISSE
jgi:hypothetical protein